MEEKKEYFLLSHKTRIEETKKDLMTQAEILDIKEDFEVKFCIKELSDFECGLVTESLREGNCYNFYFKGYTYKVGESEVMLMEQVRLNYYKVVLEVRSK